MEPFLDRADAGQALSFELTEYANKNNVIVFALPRGGVPVAYEIAIHLNVQLDVFIVRKLGTPHNPELAMGALASGGEIILNDEIVDLMQISQNDIDATITKESNELKRREKEYRGNKPFPDVKNKTIILVDDGVATGATISVAIRALRKMGANNIVLAIPVAEYSTANKLAEMVDKLICLKRPTYFYAVGAWYAHFPQTSDDEVKELLQLAHKS